MLSYAAVLVLAAFLLFYDLGNRLLWDDEALTADLAINIQKYGLPRTFDGKNHLIFLGPAVDTNGKQVWTWSPWLAEYLTAGSFSLFGKSTATARLPFALAGFFSVILLFALTYRVFNSHGISLLAGFLFTVNELFILHARQCRYYALIVFAEIWFMYGIYYLLKGSRRRGIIHAALAMAVQFYSNYMVLQGNVIALLLFAFYKKKSDSAFFNHAILSLGVVFALAAPWVIYADLWHKASYISSRNIVYEMFYYLLEMNFFMLPFAVVLIPLFVRLFPHSNDNSAKKLSGPQRDFIKFLILLIPFNLLFSSLTPWYYLRYIIPLIPVSMILVPLIITRYVKNVAAAALIVILLSMSNYISYYTLYPVAGIKTYISGMFPVAKYHEPRLPLVDLIKETVTPYTDRLKDVAAYLNANVRDNETVLVTASEFSLIFYTNIRYADPLAPGGVQGLPDWIIPESASGLIERLNAKHMPHALPENIKDLYKPHTIVIHNTQRGGSLPEPDVRERFTSEALTTMDIYRRR